MTSLGLFEVKLEAFEMRMDAKLCALFEEFRLGRSPSLRRSQHGANSDYKKNPSEVRARIRHGSPTPRRCRSPLFNFKKGTSIKMLRLNQLWVLMQCSLILGYFHDFTEERTIMLKVFPDDDLRSTAHDRKKEQEKGIQMTPQP
ncbi:hypothetical protein B296_00008038 [Ensete ventricosum]|uniref:Uncharacterized protein n=1 Tax=Ensete ventricosum TaxID=4639 RepID=A0A426ZM51_ENSVE|nr:hypothetical protein B296_00008038 [Ensete ventricosum]